jgi:chromosome segregation ATPase
LTAGTLTACNPDLDKLEEKIVEQTIQVRDKMGTLKELNSQYKALQDIVDQKKETIVQTGKKMHNNIRNDEKELRAMRKKLQENSKKIKDNLQEIKTSRTKFTDAGGDINSLGEYPDFSATIQGYESELQSIELP